MKLNKILSYFAVLVACMVLGADVTAQSVSKTGTTAGQFLKIPVGARSSAMGGAVVANVNDASAMYWNPAGLADLTRNELMVEYADWFLDIRHNYVGVAIPTRRGVAGINVTALTMGSFEETTYDQPDGTGRNFDAYMLSLGGSYATYLFPKFRVGGTAKFVHERIFDTSASAIAIDIGTLYELPFYGIKFGVSVTNVGSKMQLDGDGLLVPVDIDEGNKGNFISDAKLITDAFDLPLTLRVGFAWDAYKSDQLRATIAVDGNSPSDNVQSLSIGGELAFLNELIVVRGGVPYLGLRDRIQLYTLGMGINYGFNSNLNLRFGYAFEAYEYLNSVNRVTLQILF